MDKDTFIFLIIISFFFIFIFGLIAACFIEDKIEKDHELKKIGILKPNSKKIKI